MRRGLPERRHRVLVVHCHPLDTSLVAAARDRVLAGLARTDAHVRHIDLYAERFHPTMSAEERRTHKDPGVVAELQPHADALAWCDTLVFTYPTWWGGQPAMLKGWFDRVWVSGVAWELPDGANRIRGLLRNIRRIVVVSTHGSDKKMNMIEGEGGKRTVSRSLRPLCHPLTKFTWLALYGVDTASPERITEFLDRVEAHAERIGR